MNDANAEPQAITAGCPGREVLRDLALGKVPAEVIERLGQHIEACPTCQGILESLDGLEDSVIADIKGQAGPLPPGPELEQQIRDAEQISHVAWGDPPDDPLPAQLGQYEVQERIGRGGMGAVYRALHPRLKRLVAIKVLPEDRLRSPQAVIRFQREMEAVGRLDHPHLVRAHDAGEADGRHFLVMEFIDGIDLRKLVRQHGPLAVADACEIVRQASMGLQYAHEHGLIHRDIKPSNLMLTGAGAVKVLDLGLARVTEKAPTAVDMTNTDQIVGTGGFIAPEQGQDTRAADARSDIYSLGCTLYFLLAGQAPFTGSKYDTFVKKVVAHAGEPLPPIQSIRTDVPDAVTKIIERMTTKDPAKRFQTAAEVAEAVSALAGGSDLQGAVAGRLGAGGTVIPPRISRQARGRPWLSIALLLVVIVLTIGGWYVIRSGAGAHHAGSSPDSEPLTMEKAKAISQKIAQDMEPSIRKMQQDFAEMQQKMNGQREAMVKSVQTDTPDTEKTTP